MITKKLCEEHFSYNEPALVAAPFFRRVSKHFYIENQAQWGSIKYGWFPKSNMAYSGCGIIAVWNVLEYFRRVPRVGTAAYLANLISDFEKFGAVLGGAFGTSVYAVFFYLKRYFKKTGFSLAKRKPALDRLGERYQAFVVITPNDALNIARGLHIVCITRDSRGFSVHNAYKKTRAGFYVVSIPYKTLSEAIENICERPLPLAIIGVAEA